MPKKHTESTDGKYVFVKYLASPFSVGIDPIDPIDTGDLYFLKQSKVGKEYYLEFFKKPLNYIIKQ